MIRPNGEMDPQEHAYRGRLPRGRAAIEVAFVKVHAEIFGGAVPLAPSPLGRSVSKRLV